MLPTLITERVEIKRNQTRLEKELKVRGEHLQVSYATRGRAKAEGDLDIYYFEEFRIFWNSGNSDEYNRYWNGFGVGKPTNLVKHAFQVNIPKEGVNRQVRGGFLKFGREIFLLHRGPLGGGRKDGSHDVREIVPQEVIEFDDDGKRSKGIAIPFVDSNDQFENDFLPRIKVIIKSVAHRLERE